MVCKPKSRRTKIHSIFACYTYFITKGNINHNSSDSSSKAITLASYGAAGGIGAVSAASVPLIPIALAVVAVILTLALLFAFLTGRSKELTSTLDKQADTMSNLGDSYSDLGDDINVNTSQVSENSNTNRSEIHVDIDAHGDTQMSQENAELVADALSDRINRELGGKI